MSAKRAAVTAGLHPEANLSHFTPYEQELIQKQFCTEFYVTNQGGVVELSRTSVYRFFLIKPTTVYQEQFNLDREIVVLFSDYPNFEPRTLDAIEEAYKRYQELRIEKICSVLISRDVEIEQKIKSLLKNTSESQIIVPFHYKELQTVSDLYFFRNRFKAHFYSRDLFSYESALKKDLYFFGRSDLVHKVVNRHRSGENSALFGLRKTGKTSIIFGIRRVLNATEENSVYIDCQDSGFYLKRWNHALRYIIDEIKSQNHASVILSDESEYTEDGCSAAFARDISKLRKKLGGKPIMIIFDELERITFGLSSAEHWKTGKDFVHFWRTLRSLFQKLESVFTYLIVSTNPRSVETPMVNGDENPIFSQVPYEYIPPFDVPQTKEMVERLSQIMGLHFDEILYSKLTEDFGGHPFLIRMVCSAINRLCDSTRPVRVDKTVYEKGKQLFNKEYSSYIEMVVTVLRESYSDEFEMLKFLALGDIPTFMEFASASREYTNHLLGYNIVDQNNQSYSFKIESIREYLISENKYKKLGLTKKEMLAEISERRNELEPRLRNLVRQILLVAIGESAAATLVRNIYGDPRKTRYAGLSYKELFNPNRVDIYWDDLQKIVLAEWDHFQNVFERDREAFIVNMKAVNKYRSDAHAKDISPEEMELFRVCATRLETQIRNFFGG